MSIELEPKTANKKKSTKLTLYLLREGTSLDEAFDRKGDFDVHEVSDALPFKARLVSNPGPVKTPAWANYLLPAENTSSDKSLASLVSRSPRAALALEVEKRVFVIPFGTAGWHLVNDARIEPNFGLRVALNSIEDSYKSMDSKLISNVILDIRRQSSIMTLKETFSLEEDREQLLNVVGRARYGLFDYQQVIGRDALQAPLPGSVKDLGLHCRDILKLYRLNNYKSRGFGFIDNVREVREPDLIVDLDNALQKRIRSSQTDVTLTAPKVVDHEKISGYKHKGQRAMESELELSGYINAVGKAADAFSVEDAKKDKVRVCDNDGELTESWKIYDCLYANVKLDDDSDHIFIISAGKWYKVASTYAQKLFEDLRAIPNQVVELPDWDGGSEAEYNEFAAQEKGYELYDGCLLKPSKSSRYSKVEPCDLYCSSGKLIHVKTYTRSSALSHLFAQGVVSANLILNDPDFRSNFCDHLTPGGKHMITRKRRPQPENLTVVYAILRSDDKGSWPECLPFFSLVNLRTAVKHLKDLGLNVAIQRIVKRSPGVNLKLPPPTALKVMTSPSNEKDSKAIKPLTDAS